MPRVVHFEIPADDPTRAVEFYEKVFGWKVNKWGGPQEYWLAETGPEDEAGINGAISRRTGPGNVVNTIGVPSVDDFILKIKNAGGKVTMDKSTIPGIGYLAYFLDTEGNVFGILEADESAR